MAREGRFVHENLNRRVAEYLREEILWSGRLKTGQHIQEMEIAEHLNISRAPVREALRELEQQGLVKFLPRRGTYVAKFDHDDFLEIVDIRCMIESRVFETIITQRKLAIEDFKRLREMVGEMVVLAMGPSDDEQKITNFSERDIMFHRYIWEKSGRKWSFKILTDMYYQLRLAMMQDMIMEQDMKVSAEMHYGIIDCLENNDLEGARKNLLCHIFTLRREPFRKEEMNDLLKDQHFGDLLNEGTDAG
ncbi:MAG: GntR family transcriptional regulator [Thermovirgaceae bacterium]|nr:GntR family transcriptional regulator [Thermovirgaceae bacterium]